MALKPNKKGVVTGTSKSEKINWSDSAPWKKDLTVNAGNGNDTVNFKNSTYKNKLNGQDGNDTIYGGSNNDSITGGTGNDKLYGYNGNDTIKAGSGNDIIDGGSANDKLYGETGNDTIKGGKGNDQIWGGKGNDRIYFQYDDNIATFSNGDGNDTIYSGTGNDILKFTGFTNISKLKSGISVSKSGNNLILKYNSNKDSITLSDYFKNNSSSVKTLMANNKETINLTSFLNTKSFNFSGQKVTGTIFKDIIKGTTKSDNLNGGNGNDKLYGLAGNDKLYGGSGNDTIEGGKGTDTIYTGTGTDTIVINKGDGNDTIYHQGTKTTVQIKSANTKDKVSYKKSGNDLVMTYTHIKVSGEKTNTKEVVTFKNYFNADGTVKDENIYLKTSATVKIKDKIANLLPQEPTDPTGPINPDPTGPVNPDPTGPVNPDPTGPINPDPTGPINPDPTGPVNPDPTNPANPTEPIEPTDKIPHTVEINKTSTLESVTIDYDKYSKYTLDCTSFNIENVRFWIENGKLEFYENEDNAFLSLTNYLSDNLKNDVYIKYNDIEQNSVVEKTLYEYLVERQAKHPYAVVNGDDELITSQTVNGTFLDETLTGTIANDIISSSYGIDNLVGNAGNDELYGYVDENTGYNDVQNAKRYVFSLNSGKDIVYNSKAADTIVFMPNNQNQKVDLEKIKFIRQITAINNEAGTEIRDNDLTIQYSDNDSIIIADYFKLNQNDRISNIAEINTNLQETGNYTQINEENIVYKCSNSIYDYVLPSGNNTIEVSPYGNTINLSEGVKTIDITNMSILKNCTIYNTDKADKIIIKNDNNYSAYSKRQSGNDLLLFVTTYGNNTDESSTITLRFKDFYGNETQNLEKIYKTQNEKLNISNLGDIYTNKDTEVYTSLNDVIIDPYSNSITPGEGDDTILLYQQNPQYIHFSKGSGNDTIYYNYSNVTTRLCYNDEQSDSSYFSTTLTGKDITLYRTYLDGLDVKTDSVTIKDYADKDKYAAVFDADNNWKYISSIPNKLIIQGNSDSDNNLSTLTTNGAIIIGKNLNDTITANSSIVYTGSGNDEININGYGNTIFFNGSGIKNLNVNNNSSTNLNIFSSDVKTVLNLPENYEIKYEKSGNNLLIGNNFVINDFFALNNNIINSIYFSNLSGTKLTNDINNKNLYIEENNSGTDFNDIISISNPYNMYGTGKGNDTITISSENSNIKFANGDGNDIIEFTNDYAYGNLNLYFDENTELKFEKNNEDFIITREYQEESQLKQETLTIKNYIKGETKKREVTFDIGNEYQDFSQELYSLFYDDKVEAKDSTENISTGLGNDTISAGTKDCTINAGKDNDIIYGGVGNSVYEFTLGDGNDYIYSGSGNDTIKINSVTFDDLSYKKNGDDLTVQYSENDSVILKDFFNKIHSVKNILIGNETHLIEDCIILNINGTNYSDTINTTQYTEYITPKTGDDTITLTGGKQKTIYLNNGDGNKEISGLSDYTKLNIINNSATNVSYMKSNNDLYICNNFIENNRQYRTEYTILKNVFSENGEIKSENIKFNNTVLTKNLITDINTITETNENNNITGSIFNDRIIIGNGNDTITTGVGDNIIDITGEGTKNLTITDRSNAIINIQNTSALLYINGISWKHCKKDNNDFIVYQSYYDNKIFKVTIKDYFSEESTINNSNIKISSKTPSNFINTYGLDIIGETNSENTLQGIAGYRYNIIGGNKADIIYSAESTNQNPGYRNNIDAGDGNDTIYLENYNDVTPGKGNDTISSGSGHNILIFNKGDGNDTIINGNGTDVIKLNTKSNLVFSRTINNNDLVITYGNNDSITLQDYFVNNSHSVQTINNGDENLTVSEALTKYGINIKGTNNNETITGTNINDTITAGKGNDSINGGTGNNTLIFNTDDGNDTIVNGTGNDTIEFTNVQDLSFSRDFSNNDLIILYGENNSIALQDYFVNNSHSVKTINNFGENISLSDVVKIGTDNGDTITGYKKGSIIFAKGGNDYIEGYREDFNDIYANDIIYGGYGNDTIDGWYGNDYIDGGAGHDCIYSGSCNNTVYGGIGNDQIYAGDGNDYLYGGDGNDLIWGSGGNDYIDGGSGNNTYQYDLSDFNLSDEDFSDGYDTIANGGGNDTIRFTYYENGNETTSKKASLNYNKNNNNLVIKYSDYASITLEDYFVNNSHSVQTIINSDETLTLSESLNKYGIDINNTNNQDSIIGTDYKDNIVNSGIINKSIYGNDGDDNITNKGTVYSTGDNGTIEYGEIHGGEGNDTITNDIGAKVLRIYGEDSDNTIINKGNIIGTISIYGGDDNDTIENYGTAITVSGNGGNDNIINRGELTSIFGCEGDDNITNYGEVQTISGGKGNDTITNEIGGIVNDINGDNSDVDENPPVLGADTIINKGTVTGRIYGCDGDDTIISDGVVGDGIFGGKGNDSYKNSKLTNYSNIYDKLGDKDIISITEINKADMIVYYSENDLYIKKVSDFQTDNIGIKVRDQFVEGHSIEEIHTADGYYLTTTQINQLRENIESWIYNNGFESVQQIIDSNNETNINNLIAELQKVDWQQTTA